MCKELECICDGWETCLKECECKKPHSIYLECADPYGGSCYHNDHNDEKYHECSHVLWEE